jgi:hypothetical protein
MYLQKKNRFIIDATCNIIGLSTFVVFTDYTVCMLRADDINKKKKN